MSAAVPAAPSAAEPPPARPAPAADVAELITALQSRGLRVEVPLAARAGGAGPADAGMLHVAGVPTTVPTAAAYVASSPYVLRGDDDGSWGIWRDGTRLADASLAPRPRYYDLTTDPHERHNLIRVPAFQERIALLRDRLFDELEAGGGLAIPLRRPRGERLDDRKLRR